MGKNILQERLKLALGRLDRIEEELSLPGLFDIYFHSVARFLRDEFWWDEEEKPEVYERSWLNPVFTENNLGEELGKFLSALYYEIYSLSGLRGEDNLEEKVIRMELFLEIYGIFLMEWHENQRLPQQEALRQSFYWFAFDYADVAAEKYVKELAHLCAGEQEYTSSLHSKSILYGFLPEECGKMPWDIDHREDVALVIDKGYVSRKLEVFRTALEQQKISAKAENVKMFASGSNMQTSHLNGVVMNKEQKRLWAEYCRHAENIWKEHCKQTPDSPEDVVL